MGLGLAEQIQLRLEPGCEIKQTVVIKPMPNQLHPYGQAARIEPTSDRDRRVARLVERRGKRGVAQRYGGV